MPRTFLTVGRRLTKEKKAVGNDGLGGEIFKAAPEQMARIYYPLTFKTFANIKVPLQDCGGECLDLYKGKGDVRVRKNYRDVLLSNESCRKLGKLLRPNIFCAVSRFEEDNEKLQSISDSMLLGLLGLSLGDWLLTVLWSIATCC